MEKTLKNAMTRWWWIRHAPLLSCRKAVYGQRDVDCDLSAREALGKLASILPKKALWISSPLRRALKTAQEVYRLSHDHAEPVIHLDPHLQEQSFGRWENRDWDHIKKHDPVGHERFWNDPFLQAPPKGESGRDVSRRCWTIIKRLMRSHKGRDIILFTHAGVIRAAITHALGLSYTQSLTLRVDYLSLTRLEHTGHPTMDLSCHAWRVAGINLVLHDP